MPDLSLMGISSFVATAFLIAAALGSTIICDQVDSKPKVSQCCQRDHA